jgi:hypothetical protein
MWVAHVMFIVTDKDKSVLVTCYAMGILPVLVITRLTEQLRVDVIMLVTETKVAPVIFTAIRKLLCLLVLPL